MNPPAVRIALLLAASAATAGRGGDPPPEPEPVGLPVGPAPEALTLPHFPDRTHAVVWRNWELVPTDRIASVLGATPSQVLEVGRSMGLPDPPAVDAERRRRSYVTVIRRNWHLLPYDQLLELLGWSEERLAFTLREDDFLFIKLGSLKPRCEPVRYAPPDAAARGRAAEIAAVVRSAFPEGVGEGEAAPFDFVRELSSPAEPGDRPDSRFSPRFCSSYFALYGDPLLEGDPYPDGYLARLAASGVDAVWLPALLSQLAPSPWESAADERRGERLRNLRDLIDRAGRRGVGVYLYLNEPRSLPAAFFEGRADLRGVDRGDHAALCVSAPEVRAYLRDALAHVARSAPGLAGVFTITASENPTNCWSHGKGDACPRCGPRGPAAVVAGLNADFREGLRRSATKPQLIVWDWGWKDEWAEDAIDRLPRDVSLMSVSEWSIPIRRGGVDSVVGEYSISAVGPGPRATRHWKRAEDRGLRVVAKIQAGNTWELSAVPYIPAVENVARHAANLRDAGVDGVMLGWTLGGHPSPNLEVVAEIGRPDAPSVDEAMTAVAARRFGDAAAPAAVEAWRSFSRAFSEFPYHIRVVYNAPLQAGPANLLWPRPTGYRATMVGLPYDDLKTWRGVYPPDVFASQLQAVADGFDDAAERLENRTSSTPKTDAERAALRRELDVARAAAAHFRSVANQSRFVAACDAEPTPQTTAVVRQALESEIELARRLHAIQRRDSRIGFEATNHYFYTPLDLVEKVVSCRHLLAELDAPPE